jgi:hypothetical protein
VLDKTADANGDRWFRWGLEPYEKAQRPSTVEVAAKLARIAANADTPAIANQPLGQLLTRCGPFTLREPRPDGLIDVPFVSNVEAGRLRLTDALTFVRWVMALHAVAGSVYDRSPVNRSSWTALGTTPVRFSTLQFAARGTPSSAGRLAAVTILSGALCDRSFMAFEVNSTGLTVAPQVDSLLAVATEAVLARWQSGGARPCHNAAECGAVVEVRAGRGRPKLWCDECTRRGVQVRESRQRTTRKP